jgi:lysophospholipase L1-like esterase
MKKTLRMFVVKALLLTTLSLAALSSAAGQASLPDGVKRVLFLGDSITYAGQYVTDIETYFVLRHPELKVEFINAGLPSETASGLSEEGHANGEFPRPDLHERLSRVLEQTKPDLIIACYGINDGIYKPFSEERFARFREGIQWLHEQAGAVGAKIIHATPPTYDDKKDIKSGYNAVMARYSQWLLSQRTNGWVVADIHGPMDEYLARERAQKADFALAGDGVHPRAVGHWLMARAILVAMGGVDVEKMANAQQMTAGFTRGDEIHKLVGKRQEMMKDAWLTVTGHKRPGMNKGLPLAEAQARAADLEKQIRP